MDALRNVGFAVFAKPKVDEDSDVDRDMLAHIDERYREGLAALVVASADGQAFRQPLEAVARSGTPVQVLGFREHASWALASDTLEFVDLEDIAGVFREPLPRIGLDSLPEAGGLAAAVPAAVLAVDLASVTADVCDNQKAIRGSLPIQ